MAGTFSLNRGDHWDVAFHLVFDSTGGVRLTRGRPSTSPIERSMAVTAKVPKSLFTVPELSAKIVLPDNAAPPVELDLSAAETALSEALGARVALTFTDEEPKP